MDTSLPRYRRYILPPPAYGDVISSRAESANAKKEQREPSASGGRQPQRPPYGAAVAVAVRKWKEWCRAWAQRPGGPATSGTVELGNPLDDLSPTPTTPTPPTPTALAPPAPTTHAPFAPATAPDEVEGLWNITAASFGSLRARVRAELAAARLAEDRAKVGQAVALAGRAAALVEQSAALAAEVAAKERERVALAALDNERKERERDAQNWARKEKAWEEEMARREKAWEEERAALVQRMGG
ncbi:MAG: hypothetical protein M1840_001958 [Geoglossum simile]|nr:MAG: hypothetical protein M1840_001958 [Geoglossum simile]